VSWNECWGYRMPDALVAESLAAAASDVLETMFFSSVIGEAPVSATLSANALAARLQFSGARGGAFGLRLTEEAARVIAANFLAEENDEPTEQQVQEVICELANMMCGSVLSRLDRGAHFDLGQPAMVAAAEVAAPEAVSRAFDIGDGEVAMFLSMDGKP
jgi:CheY-specific phosphatase CheX